MNDIDDSLHSFHVDNDRQAAVNLVLQAGKRFGYSAMIMELQWAWFKLLTGKSIPSEKAADTVNGQGIIVDSTGNPLYEETKN